MKKAMLLGLLALAGCSSLNPQQQQIGQQIVNTETQRFACFENMMASSLAAAKTPPTQTELTTWAVGFAAKCAATYPLIVTPVGPAPAAQ